MKGFPNVTYCTLTHQSSRNWGRHAKQHAFLYQLWIIGVLLTYFFALQTTTPKILSMRLMSLDHEPKNEIMCYELEPWVLTPFLCKYGLFWALEEIPLKSMKVLTWCRSPMKWSHVVWKICPQHGETSKKSITPTHLHTRTVDTDMLFLSLKNYPNVFTKQFDMLFFKNGAFPKVFKK